MNHVIITGRLTSDPELRQTPSNVSVTRFTVAVNRPYSKDKEQEADFINCTAWRGTAEFVTKYFKKGDPIEVSGALRNNNYTDSNGVKHYTSEVLVNDVGFTQSKKSGNNSAANETDIGDLGDFEEILNDGDVPF